MQYIQRYPTYKMDVDPRWNQFSRVSGQGADHIAWRMYEDSYSEHSIGRYYLEVVTYLPRGTNFLYYL